MPLGHRGTEGLYLGLQLAVLLSKPRGHARSLLYLVIHGVLLPLSYVALLASLIALTKSMLALTADRFKLGLELPRGP
jgi:hypothetical protein